MKIAALFLAMSFGFVARAGTVETPLGAFAGGKVALIETTSEDAELGDRLQVFELKWQKGAVEKRLELFSNSEPSNNGDDYSVENAAMKNGRIEVVIHREGAYSYRGTSRATYVTSFDPKKLKFKKPTESVIDGRSATLLKVREMAIPACDPARKVTPESFDKGFDSPMIVCYAGEGDAVDGDELPSIFLERVHECATKTWRAGQKAEAAAFVDSAIHPALKKIEDDWLCQMACKGSDGAGDKAHKCVDRQTHLLGLPSRQVALANDLAFFLDARKETKALAFDLMSAVVKAHPERVVAQLNYADMLWDRDRKAEAKPWYTKYVASVAAKSGAKPGAKRPSAELERATERSR